MEVSLSNDLITQFAKLTKTDTKTDSESIVNGKIVEYGGRQYVRIDGSELLTPISSTVSHKDGERVVVTIKNHTATVTGNITSPSASSADVDALGRKVSEFDAVIADKVSTEEFEAQVGRIDNLVSDNIEIKETVTANEILVNEIKAQNVIIAGKFETFDADITNLKTTKLDADDAALTYANIDFSNIGKAAMEYFYSQSGLIENVVIDNATITGYLIGVTIKGELLEADTVVADKLVIKGEDGLYYKLNTNGEAVDSEQTDYNSLNGKIITAKSITAEKIAVEDLVAFDATIGGFNITEKAIFSEVKDSEGNTTRGVYMDSDGQINIGDESNYIKYYLAEDGTYKLVISADTIMYDVNGNQHSIADLGIIGEYIKISTYEGEPCIELGETDSDFKLLITNTRIMFMEGSGVPAYINNQSLFIKKAVIEEELQQGQFVWKARANGNLGLVWKGAVS